MKCLTIITIYFKLFEVNNLILNAYKYSTLFVTDLTNYFFSYCVAIKILIVIVIYILFSLNFYTKIK